jgi:hypothetical protein
MLTKVRAGQMTTVKREPAVQPGLQAARRPKEVSAGR